MSTVNTTSTAGTSSTDATTGTTDTTSTETTGTDTTQDAAGTTTTGTDDTATEVPQDTAAEDGGEASYDDYDSGDSGYEDYTADDATYTDSAEDVYADETYSATVTQDSRRDALLEDLYARMSSAKTQGDKAMQEKNGQEMTSAVEQVAEVIAEAQVAQAEVRKEAKTEKENKKKQQEYNQLLNQATLTMKTWKQQASKAKQWSLAEGEKKGAQEAFKKGLDSQIMESLRRKAENDTQSKNQDAEDKYSLLNQIFDGRKDANGKPIKDQRLSKGEKQTYEKQAAEEGAAPIESALMSESDKKRLAAAPKVKDLKHEDAKREAAKAKEEKEIAKTEGAELSDEVADVKAENDGVKAPTSQELESTYGAFLANGKISEEDYKILMEKLKKRDFMRKMNGAGMMASESDEQAQVFQYSAYRAQFLDNQDETGTTGKGGAATSEDASTFERFSVGAQRAVEGGYGYAAAEKARFKAISASKKFEGDVEQGLFNLNTQVYKNDKSEFVASNEDDKYTHNWTKLKQQAEEQGVIPASKLQSSDPNAAV